MPTARPTLVGTDSTPSLKENGDAVERVATRFRDAPRRASPGPVSRSHLSVVIRCCGAVLRIKAFYGTSENAVRIEGLQRLGENARGIARVTEKHLQHFTAVRRVVHDLNARDVHSAGGSAASGRESRTTPD